MEGYADADKFVRSLRSGSVNALRAVEKRSQLTLLDSTSLLEEAACTGSKYAIAYALRNVFVITDRAALPSASAADVAAAAAAKADKAAVAARISQLDRPELARFILFAAYAAPCMAPSCKGFVRLSTRTFKNMKACDEPLPTECLLCKWNKEPPPAACGNCHEVGPKVVEREWCSRKGEAFTCKGCLDNVVVTVEQGASLCDVCEDVHPTLKERAWYRGKRCAFVCEVCRTHELKHEEACAACERVHPTRKQLKWCKHMGRAFVCKTCNRKPVKDAEPCAVRGCNVRPTRAQLARCEEKGYASFVCKGCKTPTDRDEDFACPVCDCPSVSRWMLASIRGLRDALAMGGRKKCYACRHPE